MENIPLYVSLLFAATTLLTLLFFYKATRSKLIAVIMAAWMILQSFISLTGFYTVTDTIPPRFALLIGPPLLAILLTFLLPSGRKFISGLDQKWMVWLSVVRVPVEFVLFLLFTYKQIPELMTFEGRNFDILSGLSAPLVIYFGYYHHKLNRTVLLAWNFICLALLLNIVINAVLAAPFPFQQFAFDQPNVAILHFPFIWLPCLIVPAVLFSHLASISQLLKSKPEHNMSVKRHSYV